MTNQRNPRFVTVLVWWLAAWQSAGTSKTWISDILLIFSTASIQKVTFFGLPD